MQKWKKEIATFSYVVSVQNIELPYQKCLTLIVSFSYVHFLNVTLLPEWKNNDWTMHFLDLIKIISFRFYPIRFMIMWVDKLDLQTASPLAIVVAKHKMI